MRLLYQPKRDVLGHGQCGFISRLCKRNEASERDTERGEILPSNDLNTVSLHRSQASPLDCRLISPQAAALPKHDQLPCGMRDDKQFR